jgi:hypothetical protein
LEDFSILVHETLENLLCCVWIDAIIAAGSLGKVIISLRGDRVAVVVLLREIRAGSPDLLLVKMQNLPQTSKNKGYIPDCIGYLLPNLRKPWIAS